MGILKGLDVTSFIDDLQVTPIRRKKECNKKVNFFRVNVYSFLCDFKEGVKTLIDYHFIIFWIINSVNIRFPCYSFNLNLFINHYYSLEIYIFAKNIIQIRQDFVTSKALLSKVNVNNIFVTFRV